MPDQNETITDKEFGKNFAPAVAFPFQILARQSKFKSAGRRPLG
jgi:hypothetical protein